ncbi:hypothetical protein MTR_7g058370 [Medicago truncatula]|uniref:Uncharacterized protein n=1 Tax=Medicago truncatula TaxID=3880 RepID=G7L184_MEDTR|nr:hypothetical protein MTR_7g058370 [Medicago truncatula]
MSNKQQRSRSMFVGAWSKVHIPGDVSHIHSFQEITWDDRQPGKWKIEGALRSSRELDMSNLFNGFELGFLHHLKVEPSQLRPLSWALVKVFQFWCAHECICCIPPGHPEQCSESESLDLEAILNSEFIVWREQNQSQACGGGSSGTSVSPNEVVHAPLFPIFGAQEHHGSISVVYTYNTDTSSLKIHVYPLSEHVLPPKPNHVLPTGEPVTVPTNVLLQRTSNHIMPTGEQVPVHSFPTNVPLSIKFTPHVLPTGVLVPVHAIPESTVLPSPCHAIPSSRKMKF